MDGREMDSSTDSMCAVTTATIPSTSRRYRGINSMATVCG